MLSRRGSFIFVTASLLWTPATAKSSAPVAAFVGSNGYSTRPVVRKVARSHEDSNEQPKKGSFVLPHFPPLKDDHWTVAANRPTMKIAFTTMLMNEPKTPEVLDGWAVFLHSLKKYMGHLNADYIVIVTPQVNKSRPILEKLGWKIYEGQAPDINLLENAEFKKGVQRDGCCGHAEMLKAEPLLWTQYDKVVFTDTDTLIHGSFEEIFQLNKTLVWTKGLMEEELFQASLMVYQPDPAKHREMMKVWYKGSFDAPGNYGWENSGVGYFYGGRTVSGLLPYLFLKRWPEEGYMVDGCKYNNNGAGYDCSTFKAGEDDCVGSPCDTCPKYCSKFDHTKAKMNHFTECQKPWTCKVFESRTPESKKICRHFTEQWWQARKEFAREVLGQDMDANPCDETGRVSSKTSYTPVATVLHPF